LQLIDDPSPHLHHAMPMPQQLPQIPILPTQRPPLRALVQQINADPDAGELSCDD
jgi:hypothetical protein